MQQLDRIGRQFECFSKDLVSGESLPYLGCQYQLKIRRKPHRKSPDLRFERGTFLITIPERWSTKRRNLAIRALLFEWYKEHASAYLLSMTESLADHVGVEFGDVKITEMQKRWASISNNGNIRYDWRIIMSPRRLVEYVVVHELCHIKYRNHSAVFWRLVGKVLPDYELRRLELEARGPTYSL